ncbi:ABC transporter ATP-binding protein [Subtercola boreus]|uniref:Multidrug ABC transporter ATP-binding protein n=1 Tax=Subtercola boreus TaxID=120213 RepID=A0A3E0W990_9MICO|nr:ATP-binding cassette domain-containing protein [Subtercola boreus]RFA19016.1 multidrug ABC transporter ATP-binding protein [Subtercola boreus]RFA19154.1 multidrug ABC transporter ATP-binding protein [Subtercola boreus]RFA25616.1 multidrug ABC transporter ATP-binding protein [Subtercola boreus]
MTEPAVPTRLAIQTTGLTKVFGKQTVVNGIDLRVPSGSVFGFLGPNGSGKTTSIRMLLGLASATRGEISLLGEQMPRQAQAVLPRVGALIEGPGFYPFLSGTANLNRLDSADRFACSATRRTRVAEALERVGLTHAADKRVHAYSLGMKQRLGIANALLTPRELIVLDEPTNGLDPQGTREVRNLVRSLTAEGTTVFVSSHLLAEIEQMCTHAAVMRAGTLVAQGSLDELRREGQARVRVLTPDAAAARRVLAELGLRPDAPGGGMPGGTSASGGGSVGPESADAGGAAGHPLDGEVVTAPLTAPGSHEEGAESAAGTADGAYGPAPDVIVAALVAADVRVRGFAVERATLEDLFVALTGEGFDVAQ